MRNTIGAAMRRRYAWWAWAAILALLFGASIYVGYDRYHSASLTVSPHLEQVTVAVPLMHVLDWPNYGQAAIATKTYGVIATHGSTVPQPTASTAKLILAVAIMQKKPYSDSKGENITFTQADVDRYQAYVAGGGTVAAVVNGLNWTQHQALQAVLLASSNNVSDSLAIWAFGSLDAYRTYTQKMVHDFGMEHTTIGSDASGYSATTTSTAHDLALLAAEALAYQPLRDIVATQTVTLPVAGTITSTNQLLVDGAIIGMKTGWIPEAGGVFVLAGTQTDQEHTHEIITVVMGAPGGASNVAQEAAYALYQLAKANFAYRQIITQGQSLGKYHPAWEEHPTSLVAAQGVGMFVWANTSPEVHLSAATGTPGSEGVVGAVHSSFGTWSTSVPLVLEQSISQPSAWWRVVQRGW